MEKSNADLENLKELKLRTATLTSLTLDDFELCDLELLQNGGFSPLKGFMSEDDYYEVIHNMRLKSGTVWPIPITLPVEERFAKSIDKGEEIVLRHPEGIPLAILTVDSIWRIDKTAEAELIYGKNDDKHPSVRRLKMSSATHYIGGKIDSIELPSHYSYKEYRHTPQQLQEYFKRLSIDKVVAFQTRNPLHKAHYELTRLAAEQTDSHLLLHPVVGVTKPDDLEYYLRVKCYKAILQEYPANMATLSLLPLAMRLAGPREAVWHAIIRKNYGCQYFIVGRDHAGPGNDSNGKPFYGPYDAQELLQHYSTEIGVKMVPFQEMVYVKNRKCYLPKTKITEDDEILSISGTEFRKLLNSGANLPEWFSFPSVVRELYEHYPPRKKQGFTIFFTGLPSAGKSTIANVLLAKLNEIGSRKITLLDGDLVRRMLSSELTFTKEHRNLNNLRIGYVAAEITKHKGVAICSPIAPYDDIRKRVRENVSRHGGFILVYVDTPVEECAKRDRKGLYAKAKAGLIKGFTGVDDAYEIPADAEISIETTKMTPDEAAEKVISLLKKLGYLSS